MTADRLLVALGSLSALSSVAAGAFGAHALRARLSADLLEVFETAATPASGSTSEPVSRNAAPTAATVRCSISGRPAA